MRDTEDIGSLSVLCSCGEPAVVFFDETVIHSLIRCAEIASFIG